MDLIKPTSEGGLEMTRTTLGVLIGVITLAGMVVTATASTMGLRQQIRAATPSLRTDSIEGRLAHHDTMFTEVKGSIDSLRSDLMGFNCQRANYPSPFCDKVPRVYQAGTQRNR